MTTPALALESIHKRFGPTTALDGASCSVRSGTVHALLGENGAGKTTLMRIAFGLERADEGTLRRDGQVVQFHSGRDAIAAGLGMVHQHFMLVPALTVAENAALGGRGRFDAQSVAQKVHALGESTGLRLDPNVPVRDLPVGAQQRAELLRALAHDARVLILDEPTAVLTPTESEELYRWMRRFADAGGTVVLITHKLREALAVADDVTVLRHGRTVLAASCSSVTESALVSAIVGERVVTEPPPTIERATGAPRFVLRHVSYRDEKGVPRLRDVSLSIHDGEILGVIGVEGSGQRELLRLIAGRLAPSEGEVERPDRVGFIPEDRLHDAIIPEMRLAENLALAEAARLRGVVDWPVYDAATAELIAAHDVRAPGPVAAAATLSGGNQQKFVVARERRVAPHALVAENPTRGLDVRAAARVMQAIRDVAATGQGAAVVYSTDLEEVLALTRRVVACYDGKVTEVAAPADAANRRPYAEALLGVTR